jgi:signal transduction histidine kinase
MSNSIWHELLSATHGALLEIDGEGRCIQAWGAQDAFAENPVGRMVADLIAGPGGPALLDCIRHVRANGRGETLEYAVDTPGQRRHYLAEITCLPDGGRVACLTRDITEWKHSASRVQQNERLSAVGRLAAGVAHQLKNPLEYIATNLSFLVDELDGLNELATLALRADSPTEQRTAALMRVQGRVAGLSEAVGDAQQGVRRVKQTAVDLTTFARGTDEEAVPIDVGVVLDSCVNLSQHEIRQRAMLFRDFQPTPPVMGNETRLAHVFFNLLANAVQATPPGDAFHHEIHVSAGSDAHGNALVQIRDTGAGINEEHLSRIFEPFFTTRPVGAGSGLGLAICHGIVTAMGGRITVESVVGRGTTVRITLPFARKGGLVAFNPATPAPEAAPARVLLVDDETMLAAAMRRLLGTQYDVAIAHNGREALELLEHDDRFDLILCDLRMPEVNGIELYERLAARKSPLLPRIVFMTGDTLSLPSRDFLARVTNPSIEKPVDIGSVRALIAQAALTRGTGE